MTREQITNSNPDVDFVFLDDLDDAMLGVAQRFGMGEPVVCYDRDACISLLSLQLFSDVTDSEEALDLAAEWFETNIFNTWNGPRTPIFFTRLEDEEI